MSDDLKALIGQAANGPLTRDQAIRAFEIIMSGEATPAQTGGLLMTLRTRGETVDEIAGAGNATDELSELNVRCGVGARRSGDQPPELDPPGSIGVGSCRFPEWDVCG